MYRALEQGLPGWLRRYLLHFETAIEEAAAAFSSSLPPGSRILDAGAGELPYAHLFGAHRYVSVDLGIGNAQWDYSRLSCIADLGALPLAACSFDACLNIVTLEHVTDPARVLREICGVLRPGGKIFLVVPLEWEVHQAPHDYFRYTCHGVRHLLREAGFESIVVNPCGGYFRLMSRRLLNGLQFFPGPFILLAALFLVPPALALPLLDGLDRNHDFTLGYLCTASKHS